MLATKSVIIVVSASIFGPYLYGGVRTEQATIYCAAALALASGLWLRFSLRALLVLSCWLAVLAVAVLAIGSPNPSHQAGSLAAGIDNLLLPLAAFTVGTLWGKKRTYEALDALTLGVVTCLLLNVVVAGVSISAGSGLLRDHFWTSDLASGAVGSRASLLGRHGGVFNQPSEAGLAYSIGLQFALWRWGVLRRSMPMLAASSGLLVFGGLLTVSKVFILLGLPVAAIAAVRSLIQGRRREAIVGIAVTLLAAGSIATGAVNWGGRSRLLRLFSWSSADISVLAAGRFGEEGTLREVVEMALDSSPLIGFGPAGIAVPYDSQWIELLLIAGIVGVALGLAMFIVLWTMWWRGFRRWPSPEQTLLGYVLFIVSAATLGMSSLTANRVGSIVWLLLGMLLCQSQSRLSRRGAVPAETMSIAAVARN